MKLFHVYGLVSDISNKRDKRNDFALCFLCAFSVHLAVYLNAEIAEKAQRTTETFKSQIIL